MRLIDMNSLQSNSLILSIRAICSPGRCFAAVTVGQNKAKHYNMTKQSSYCKNKMCFRENYRVSALAPWLIHGGGESYERNGVQVMSWKALRSLG